MNICCCCVVVFAFAEGGGPLELQGSKAGLHAEEQEEGEERPDLDKSLSVTVINPTPA